MNEIWSPISFSFHKYWFIYGTKLQLNLQD